MDYLNKMKGIVIVLILIMGTGAAYARFVPWGQRDCTTFDEFDLVKEFTWEMKTTFMSRSKKDDIEDMFAAYRRCVSQWRGLCEGTD